VPVGVAGTEGVTLPRLFFRLTRVRVAFGKPFELPKGRRINAELVEQCTERIMTEIAVLLPEEYRGVYAGLVASQSKEQAEGIGLN
jgi:hypothetical protein